MSTETILQTIKKACEGKCNYEIHLSDKSCSVYCLLNWGNITTKFRVSDHKQRIHTMRSFICSKNTKATCLERFINNTISDVKRKNLNFLLKSLEEQYA